MPRYDDRLDNVLDLLRSKEHSNSDTVFRHISDILIQENRSLEGVRRAAVLSNLADVYPKTSQPARMEVMDIAARVDGAAPELVSIAAADVSINGTRIWDRVRLKSTDWLALLPRLPKSVLGRLRGRLDLPDDIVVGIDREWRERVKDSAYDVPTLPNALAALRRQLPDAKTGESTTDPNSDVQAPTTDDLIPDNEEALFADVGQQIDEEADPLDLTNAVNVIGPPNTDPIDADAAVSTEEIDQSEAEEDGNQTLFVTPSHSDDLGDDLGDDLPKLPSERGSLIDLTDVLRNADARFEDSEAAEQSEETAETDEDTPLVEDAETAKKASSSDIVEESSIEAEDEAETEIENDTIDEDTLDPELEDFALNEKPQVEEQKIQDILERLREFGSRNRDAEEGTTATNPATPEEILAVADAISSNAPDETIETGERRAANLFEPALANDADAIEPAQENAAVETEAPPRVRTSGAALFLAEQPPEGTEEPAESPGLPDAIMFDSAAGFQPLTVNGTTWVTDRFGTIAEFYCDEEKAFGLDREALNGQIFSSLFKGASQQEFDQALNTRRPFRDRSLISAVDNKTWMLSAVPVFDEDSGIFLGHRGTATGLTLNEQNADDEDALLHGASSPNEQTSAVLDVAGLAHELKTPLNAIRGFAEMIGMQQLGPASDFARHRSRRISQEADQLHHILTDLLLAKGPKSNDLEEYRGLKPAIEKALEPFSSHYDMNGLQALNTQTMTSIEPELLRSILEKMLHNCALWTPAGRNIAISVSCDDPSSARIEMMLIGWMGGSGNDDIDALGAGPRLSYRHPLLEKSFQGRGIKAAMGQVTQVGGRLFMRGAGRREAALILVLPTRNGPA